VTLTGLEAKPLVDFLVQLANVICSFENKPIYQASEEEFEEYKEGKLTFVL
jgi:hypothetical protein